MVIVIIKTLSQLYRGRLHEFYFHFYLSVPIGNDGILEMAKPGGTPSLDTCWSRQGTWIDHSNLASMIHHFIRTVRIFTIWGSIKDYLSWLAKHSLFTDSASARLIDIPRVTDIFLRVRPCFCWAYTISRPTHFILVWSWGLGHTYRVWTLAKMDVKNSPHVKILTKWSFRKSNQIKIIQSQSDERINCESNRRFGRPENIMINRKNLYR